jgi:hypothetical protein
MYRKANNSGWINCLKSNRKYVVCLVIVMAMLVLAGCPVSVEHDDPTIYTVDILSDQAADGEIRYIPPPTDSYVVSSAVNNLSVLAGIDPVNEYEYRGFLDFPLRSTGGVPIDANIDSATLEIYITYVSNSTVPMIIDLVDFQPPNLIYTDFDRASLLALLSQPIDFYASDENAYVVFDVTPLMIEAQSRGLPDLQLRFLLDTYYAAAGLIEIDDNDPNYAPLLTVSYY